MKRLLILVEGPTEERFVNDVLKEHLLMHAVVAIPTILVTKSVDSGPRFKGGVASWDQMRRDLRNLLRDSDAAGITSLLDYYGLPRDVPGMSTRPKGSTPVDRVVHVEKSMCASFRDRRFRAYLMLHEFEAMLFTNIQNGSIGSMTPSALKDIGLEAIRVVCPHFDAWLTWAEGLATDDEDEDCEEHGNDLPPKHPKKRR